MAHVKPLPRDTHPDLVEHFKHYHKTRGFVPNSILTMRRRPGLKVQDIGRQVAVRREDRLRIVKVEAERDS